jgi:hypothetical protein
MINFLINNLFIGRDVTKLSGEGKGIRYICLTSISLKK